MFQIIIIVFKCSSRIVGWIDIDTLHLAFVPGQQGFQCLQIVAVDNHVFTAIVLGVLSGFIIAVLAVLSIVTLSVFAYRSIFAGRSTYYTIAACGAMSMFIFQTMLNVFGCVDLLPFTGVTFPFVSNGGTSMMVSWALLAFLKAADTRERASIAVKAGGKI